MAVGSYAVQAPTPDSNCDLLLCSRGQLALRAGTPRLREKRNPGRWARRASLDLSIDQVEVGLVVLAGLGLLPTTDDRISVVLEPAGEALREGLAGAP